MKDLSAQKAHRDYVSGVLFYYQQNDIQPGDPNEGAWHEAHYPTPKCLGGTETIWLLKEHHAIQGVLQSEEFGCMCFAMWERDYLPEGLLRLHDDWRGWNSRRSLQQMYAEMSEDELKAHVKRMRDGITPESEAARIAASSETMIKKTARPVYLYTTSGERTRYRSVRYACTVLNLTGSHLRRTLTLKKNGDYKFHKGYRMEYVDES